MPSRKPASPEPTEGITPLRPASGLARVESEVPACDPQPRRGPFALARPAGTTDAGFWSPPGVIVIDDQDQGDT
jgi:hypothetical protein